MTKTINIECGLKEFFDEQTKLQEALGQPLGEGEAALKECVLAAQVELVEVLNEVNWKPWKKSKKVVNKELLVTELVDVFQFLVNGCIAMDIKEEDLMQAYAEKLKINYQRIEENY